MKKTNNIKTKITAICLSAVCAVSFGSMSIATASAATGINKSEAEIGKGMIEKVVGKATADAMDSIKKLFKSVPYIGEYGYLIFEYTLNAAFGADSCEPGASMSSIAKQLSDVQEAIKQLSIDSTLKNNERFNTNIDNLRVFFTKNFSKLKDLANEQKKLEEIKKDSSKTISDIATQEAEIELCKQGVIDILDSSTYDLLSSLMAIQNSIADMNVGNDKNAFVNYFNANCASQKFSNNALESSKKYETNVMKVFTTGVSLYTTICNLNIQKLTQEKAELEKAESANPKSGEVKQSVLKQKEIEKWQRNLSRFLTGVEEEGDDAKANFKSSENYLNSVAYAAERYTEIANSEKSRANRYYKDENSYVKLHSLATAKMQDYRIYSTSSNVQFGLLTYMFDYNRVDKKFEEFLKDINAIINDKYINNSENHAKTLRTFLKENGINVPEQSHYLVLKQTKRFVYSGYITAEDIVTTIINLDKTNAVPERYNYFHGALTDIVYNNKSDLCYFVSCPDSQNENIEAEVTYNDQTIPFTSVESAWNAVVTSNKNATLKLKKDWIAQKHGEETFTRFGSGVGFKNGAIFTEDHGDNSHITIDLNGHKIDRNQTTACSDGSVIIVGSTNLYINDFSGTGKGVITGGNTTGKGGAIVEGDYLGYGLRSVSNCNISGNHANGYGGGVYLSEYNNGCEFSNCNITANSSNTNGGGVFARVSGAFAAETKLNGKVNITGNTAKGSTNNFTLDENSVTKATTAIQAGFDYRNSSIGVNTTTGQSSIRITNNVEKSTVQNWANAFSSDFSNKKIIVDDHWYMSGYFLAIKNR